MLSIGRIKSVAKAVDYFKDNYYVQESQEFPGIWGGAGANLLGLRGSIKLLDFVAVLKGALPPDLMMPVTTNKRRLAYDLTFSAPKSVSILALIGKDERVVAAHQVAVDSVLSYLEQHYAATRIKVKGKTTIEKTNNLLFARFEHIESRELDPDLHTHIVLMNATRLVEPKWRALYIDPVYEDQKLLGVIYRGKLVQELMRSGFEITQTSEQGFFELKGFKESVIKQFSKRREQIQQELAKKELTGAKAAQLANFNTRPAKQKITLPELEQQWLAELATTGIDLAWLKDYSAKALARGPVIGPNPYQLAQQALAAAINHLSKWQPSFTTKKLLQVASGLSIISFSPMLLEKALAEQFARGQLWYLKDDICTTQANRDLEIANVINMRQSKNKVVPMFTDSAALYVVSKVTQQPKLQLVLKQLLTNTDRQLVCSATTTVMYAEAMQLLVKLAKEYGFYPIGLTQTVKRIEPFTKELELTRVQTVAGFLMSCANRAEQLKGPIATYKLANARQIWILDVAGGITVSDVNSLQQYAKQFGARIIWGYNAKRPQAAIDALLHHGIQECNLEGKRATENLAALMVHPKLHIINNAVDINNWQANTASTLIHWLAVNYQERHAVFSVKDLQLELFSLGLTVPKEVLQAELKAAFARGSLIKVLDQLVTTKDTLLLEQACLELAIKNQGMVNSIMEPEAIFLPKNLTIGQSQAIELILTSKDRVIGIQGIAGSGKTTMLRTLKQLCGQAGFEIIGLATATSARERLQEGSREVNYEPLLRSGIKVFTTRKFLINSEKLLNVDPTLAHLEYGVNKLFVLDEASFVSTAEMFAVLTKMDQLQAKLIVMGDHKQLPSVEAGRIFYLMLGSNMQSVAMRENVRFNSAKALTVMKYIYNKQITQALEELGTSIIEIPDHQERLITMAKLYVAKTAEEQANTILITPEHVDRKIVNEEIRKGLKANGQLQGVELNCHNLTEIKLTRAKKQNIYYFKEQDWVYFSKTATKIELYNYYQIIVKNLEDRTLVLEHVVSKEQIIWSPERQIGVFNIYRQETRSLMANDQLRWLKNNEPRGILNGQSATVLAIKDNNEVEVKLQDGTLIVLDLKKLDDQHWDHAYAATAFVAQGIDKLTAIGLVKGGYGREIRFKDLTIGKVIMVLDETATQKNLSKYKWAKVMAITEDHIATVQDSTNAIFSIDLKKSPTNLDMQGQAIWYSYADPKFRKKSEIPKLTSIEEWLVSVTRGDNVILLVDHLESYQHTLEQKLSGTRSALEFLAPNRAAVKAKLQSMIQNITGKVNSINNVVNKEDQQQQKKARERHSLYKDANFVTVEQVINKLHGNILQYSTNWLGRPQKVSNYEARWGKKGSLVVKLSGAKAGYWHDFAVGKGGKNLISLYIDCFNIDFKTAMANLSKELNIYNETRLFKEKPLRKLDNRQQEAKLRSLTMKKINYAKELYARGTPIAGTLAEKYLRVFRGIEGSIPDDFRFCSKLKHPDLGYMVLALIAPIKNEQQSIQGVVRIFLSPEGNKLNASYVDNSGNKLPATVKANLGSLHHAGVIIKTAQFPGTVYVAEGIETALSIAAVKPLDTVIAALSVSNLKNVPLPFDTQKIVLCADQDGANTASNKALINAAKAYLERGLQVAIAYPASIKGMAKVDFNDVLKILGVNSIANSLQQAIPQTLTNLNTMATKEYLPAITNKIKELNR